MAQSAVIEEINATAARLGFDLTHLDLGSIRLPPNQNLGIPSDDEDLHEEENLEFDQGFGNIIVVDNLPVVAREKFEKLEGVIRKIYSQIGVIREDGLWMPVDPETQKTMGYCFVEFNTSQEAELAREKTHGYKLDRSHILTVSMFDDFDRFMKVPNEWAPPETKPYTSGENLQNWLTDAKARDQFVIRAGSDTEVLWNDARHLKPDPVYKRAFWTDSFVQWSPLGTYLATVHRQGAAVWGGASAFNRLMRYAHSQVKLIDFSPGEKYLVTYSSHEPSNPRDSHRMVINIFDVRTGKLMRDFKGSADDFSVGGAGGVTGVSWPIFRWAGGRDDKYFAKMGKNMISIYETETFSLVDKKSLKVESAMDFSFSPTDPILALFVPELGGGNQPARVSLVQIPSKQELRQKNLFSVSDCKMYWQSNGEYLAVKVDRYTKTKKSTYTGFELFRIKERDIPIEVLELENKNDKIIAFAWEPKGHRFAIIHGDGPRPDVSFYTMRSGHSIGRVAKLTTLKGKQANALFWSPSGHHIVLAGLKGFNGQLEFYNVDELESMATAEHFMATDVDWDPTGRYVATAVTSVHEMENGFNIWSFNGKLLYRTLKDHFFQFLWRPRPPSLLSPEKEEEIAKNLKKYSKKYEAEDQDVSLLLSEQERERRRMLKEEWEKWCQEWKQLHEDEQLERQELRDGDASDKEEEYEAKEVDEKLTELPLTNHDQRPRKRTRLGWDVPPIPMAQVGLSCGQEVRNLTNFASATSDISVPLLETKVGRIGSPPWQGDDEDGHYIYDLGDSLTSRFEIHGKMGEGTFGQVLECWDRDMNELVAIKIVRGVQKYRDAAMIEIEMLQKLEKQDKGGSRCVQIRNWFDYRNHICIVFEKLGPSLYDFLQKNNYRSFPIDVVRDIGQQLLECVAFMHNLKMIHTDLKPENILLVSPDYDKVMDFKSSYFKRVPKSSAIKVIDFGSTTYDRQDQNYTVSTRHYRAPEVILGIGWSHPCDVWSVGCILVELCTGEALFQTCENLEHLAMMEQVFGPLPKKMLKRVGRHADKYLRRDRLHWPGGASSGGSLRAVLKLPRLQNLIMQHVDSSAGDLIHLLQGLLRYDPSERLSAREALGHPFFAGDARR